MGEAEGVFNLTDNSVFLSDGQAAALYENGLRKRSSASLHLL